MAADSGSALAVQPELAARLGTDRHEALAATRISQAHYFGGGACHRIRIVTGNIAY